MLNTWWGGWAVLGGSLLGSYLVALWAPETAVILLVCGPVAHALYHHLEPRRPMRFRNRKDRA